MIEQEHFIKMEKQRFTYNRLKVSFNPNIYILKMHVWQYAYHKARIGTWRHEYLDRMRFQKIVKNADKIISLILTTEHRMKIQNKLKNKTNLLTYNNNIEVNEL